MLVFVTALLSATVAETPRVRIDEELGGIERPFGRYPDTLSFGPTGARLWVNFLEQRPGFVGRMDLIHRTNIPELFQISVKDISGTEVEWRSIRHEWYPSHLRMVFEAPEVRMTETKWVTWEDVAISHCILENISEKPCIFAVSIFSVLCGGLVEDLVLGEREIHGLPVKLGCGTDVQPGPIPLVPGQSTEFMICFSAQVDESPEPYLRSILKKENPLEIQKEEYQRWFDGCPIFESSDPCLNRLWAYRWYLLRRNLAHPGTGKLPYPLYYEGRGHKMNSDPWEPKGWDFSKLIPFSTPFHLLEGRWHRDISPCIGEIESLLVHQGGDGLFQCGTIHRSSGYYANFIPWAIRELLLVHPDARIPEGTLDALKRSIQGWFKRFDPDGNFLCHVTDHNRTGKEYQPSYWYFEDYPEDARGSEKALLERVDLASYLHLNALALASLCAEAGDTSGEREFRALAENIRKAVLREMWDEEREFFFDIRESDKAKAFVFNVVGFDPFFGRIADGRHMGLWKHLSDPVKFGTPWPVPSVSIDNPAFAPDASWLGDHLKGLHGAMWNGPTWPFTNSTVLMSLARATRIADHDLDDLFSDLFRKYSLLHFLERNLDRPNVFEHYNPFSGKPISEEEDYYHSSWIDLAITCIGGLIPSSEEPVELDPIDCGLSRFRFRRIPYRGRELEIEWDGKQLSLSIDGRLVAEREGLGRLVYPSR